MPIVPPKPVARPARRRRAPFLVIAAASLAAAPAVQSAELAVQSAEVAVQSAELARQTYRQVVDEAGAIRLPADFRLSWVHLGSWLVADPKAPGHGFHDVYTQPAAARAYRETGTFPDGTVLVKEIRTIGDGSLTTGAAQWASDPAVWFVMVKDSGGRFAGNAHWGDGWGWALFEAKDPTRNASASYAETCQGCHVPAAATDRVFVGGYPTLKR